jgi:hypothetical protein
MTQVQTLVAGDTLSFTTPAPTGPDGIVYAHADGWTLKYRLLPRSGAGTAIAITAATSGDDYWIAVPASVTALWGAGWYSVAAWVEKGAEVYTVEPLFDQCEIKANPRTAAAGYDGRSPAQKAWDDVIDAIGDAAARAAAVGTGNGAMGGVLEYQIGDRRMRYSDPDKAMSSLLQLKSEIAMELKRERRRTARERGEPDPYRTYLRLGRG